jgi:Skp family chaperone for outer membrane proteins
MNRIPPRINIALVGLTLVFGAILGYRAMAQHGAGISPPIVAAVRIEALFDNLLQRAEAKSDIAALEDELEAEKGRRQEAINAMELQLEDLVAAAKREELADKIALERMKNELWFRQAQMELEMEKALRLKELYRSIKTAVAEMAEAEGYDIVVLNDESDELPYERDARVPPQLQILQQITTRKLLYLRPNIDVTDALAVRMNNAYRTQ